MKQISKDLQFNVQILKECREQMNFSLKEVAAKVSTIEKIEREEKLPTYKQLNILADLYEVPRWVFISEILPEKFRYTKNASFRKFSNLRNFDSPKLRKLIMRVEHYRDLLIDLRISLSEQIPSFNSPDISNVSEQAAAQKIRQWLEIDTALNFDTLKEKLEEKNIFVFLTSKHLHWSHIEKTQTYRGLCLPHEAMPIVIINDSDAKKAQSFTLIHELGHLLRKNPSIDDWTENDIPERNSPEEKWCDEFAGNILMPKEQVDKTSSIESLDTLKNKAKDFKISPYAFLIRLIQLNKITQQECNVFKNQLEQEYEEQQKKWQNNKGGPPRRRSKEVRRQFGNLFINTILAAWHNEEITLLKASQILNLKVDDFLELEK